MKTFTLVLLLMFTGSASYAGHEKVEDLANALEKVVSLASKGDFASAARAMNAEARRPREPKELIEQTDSFKNLYGELQGLGEGDGVERISLRLAGASFARLKIVDKRAEGAVVWTFIGYRFRGQWYLKNITINGSDDLLKLMKEELDAADASPVPPPSE